MKLIRVSFLFYRQFRVRIRILLKSLVNSRLQAESMYEVLTGRLKTSSWKLTTSSGSGLSTMGNASGTEFVGGLRTDVEPRGGGHCGLRGTM